MDTDNNQIVIILMGVPCSGKSTLATTVYKDFTRVNQDELRTRDKCEEMYEFYLATGHNIILDRCNSSKDQRKWWIDTAKRYGVSEIECIFVDTPITECELRILSRENHPTIKKSMSIKKKLSIIAKFAKSIQKPELSEGFTKITIINENTACNDYKIGL